MAVCDPITYKAHNPDYQIAPGHDNEINLRIFEEIEVSNGRPQLFVEPRGMGNYDVGEHRVRGDGLLTANGFAVVTWAVGVMSREGHYWLRTWLCTVGGVVGYSGEVTVRTTVGDAHTFGNYNAVLHLPKDVEAQYRIRQYADYEMLFTRLELITP